MDQEEFEEYMAECRYQNTANFVPESEAAKILGVSVRHLSERLRKRMCASDIIEPEETYESTYDFEELESWDDYKPMIDPENLKLVSNPEDYVVVDTKSAARFRSGTWNPGFDSEMGIESKTDYDGYLQPKSRRRKKQGERLYNVEGLMLLMDVKLARRETTPVPPRGEDGRFVKRS